MLQTRWQIIKMTRLDLKLSFRRMLTAYFDVHLVTLAYFYFTRRSEQQMKRQVDVIHDFILLKLNFIYRYNS